MVAEAGDDLEEVRQAALLAYRKMRAMGFEMAAAAALGQYVSFSLVLDAELDPEVEHTGLAMIASLRATARSMKVGA